MNAPTILQFRFKRIHTSIPPAKTYTGRRLFDHRQKENKRQKQKDGIVPLLNFLISLIPLRLSLKITMCFNLTFLLTLSVCHVYRAGFECCVFLQPELSRRSPLNSWQKPLCPRRDPSTHICSRIRTNILLDETWNPKVISKRERWARETISVTCEIHPFSMSWGENVL